MSANSSRWRFASSTNSLAVGRYFELRAGPQGAEGGDDDHEGKAVEAVLVVVGDFLQHPVRPRIRVHAPRLPLLDDRREENARRVRVRWAVDSLFERPPHGVEIAGKELVDAGDMVRVELPKVEMVAVPKVGGLSDELPGRCVCRMMVSNGDGGRGGSAGGPGGEVVVAA